MLHQHMSSRLLDLQGTSVECRALLCAAPDGCCWEPVRPAASASTLPTRPLDHVNVDAHIVIVGLTPGRQQMRNALVEARRCLRAGRTEAS
jgi:hypothetical protein